MMARGSVLQTLIFYFRPNFDIFCHRFSDQAISNLVSRIDTRFCKIHTRFQTLRQKLFKSVPYTFQTKTAKKPFTTHQHSLYMGVHVPPPGVQRGHFSGGCKMSQAGHGVLLMFTYMKAPIVTIWRLYGACVWQTNKLKHHPFISHE